MLFVGVHGQAASVRNGEKSGILMPRQRAIGLEATARYNLDSTEKEWQSCQPVVGRHR